MQDRILLAVMSLGQPSAARVAKLVLLFSLQQRGGIVTYGRDG